MPAIPASRLLRPQLPSTQVEYVFSFLAPSLQFARSAPRSPVARFSTSPALWKRDNNRNRGLSVLKHTGLRPRQTLSVKTKKDFELPRPVAIEAKVHGDEDHGLWGFFPEDKKLLRTPAEESQHGKPWTVQDLETHMEKEGIVEAEHVWDYLHSLWWACVKERNRLATEKLERARVDAGYGDHENKHRDETVQKTMKAILDVMDKRNNRPLDADTEEYLDPYSDIPEYEESQSEEQVQTEAPKEEPARNVRVQKEEEPRPNKELPESAFFNTPENPPTLKEKMQDKAKRVLWNK